MQRGPLIAHRDQPGAAQRDRHALRLVLGLPRAGGGRGRARSAAQARSHQHRARRAPSVRIRSGPIPSASSRSIPSARWSARCSSPTSSRATTSARRIAVTRAHIRLPELDDAIEAGRLQVDGKILRETGDVVVTKAAIEPVWYLPEIAKRFGCAETHAAPHAVRAHRRHVLRSSSRAATSTVFLPPIGGATIYMFGDVQTIADPSKPLAVRVHDECNGSDVFGSDICTCRPYLTHGIEECVRTAQAGGAGVIVYNRKEGRALGEVTKFLVYNARKRQKGGDSAAQYFARTECVAGVQDMRFQELMPDVLHWLGITKIDRFVSMSNMKYDADRRARASRSSSASPSPTSSSPTTRAWRWTPRWPPATTREGPPPTRTSSPRPRAGVSSE